MPCLFNFLMWSEKYKITCMADLCGLHRVPFGRRWSRYHSSCPCPVLPLKEGLFQPSRESWAWELALPLRYKEHRAQELPTTCSRTYMNKTYPGRVTGEEVGVALTASITLHRIGALVPSWQPITQFHQLGHGAERQASFFSKTQKANEHHPKQRGRFR